MLYTNSNTITPNICTIKTSRVIITYGKKNYVSKMAVVFLKNLHNRIFSFINNSFWDFHSFWFFSTLSNLAFILCARCVVVLSECLLRLLSFEICLQIPSLRTFMAFRLCIAFGAFLDLFFGRTINDSTIPYTCASTTIENRFD